MGLIPFMPSLPPLRPRRSPGADAPAWLLLGGAGAGKTCWAGAIAADRGVTPLWLAGAPGGLEGLAAWLGVEGAGVAAALAERAMAAGMVVFDGLDGALADAATRELVRVWLAAPPAFTVLTAREPLPLPLARPLALGKLRVIEGRGLWLDPDELAAWRAGAPAGAAPTRAGAGPVARGATPGAAAGWPLGEDAALHGADAAAIAALAAEEWVEPAGVRPALALADPLGPAAAAALGATPEALAAIDRAGLRDPVTGAWHPLARPALLAAWRRAPEGDRAAALAAAEAMRRAGEQAALAGLLAALPPAWLTDEPAFQRLDGARAQAAGDYPAAAARYRQAADGARARGDRPGVFAALGDLLHLHWTREELDALDAVAAEIAPYEPDATPAERIEYLNNLACHHFGRGEEAEARARFLQALDAPPFDDAQIASVQQFAALNVGILAQEAGDFDEAVRYFDQAIAMSDAWRLSTGVRRGAWLYKAGVALRLGDRHAAAAAMAALAADPLPAGDPYRLAEFATLEGDYHLLTGDFPAAEARYRAALDGFAQARMATSADAGLALSRLAAMHRRRGELPAARRLLDQAAPLAAPWPRYRAIVGLERAVTEAEAGDLEAAEAAAAAAMAALGALRAGDLRAAIALAAASFARRRGDAAEAARRLGPAVEALLAGPYYYQAIARRELAPDLWALLAETGREDLLGRIEARFPQAAANIRAAQAALAPAPAAALPPPAPARLAVRVLGPLAVTIAGEPVTKWPRKKARALLGLLAVSRDGLDRETLADALFPDLGFEEGAHQLDVTASALRKILEPDLAPRAPSRYLDAADRRLRLRREALDLDLAAFEAELAAARAGDAAALARAADLYRGDLLDEPLLRDLADVERARLRGLAIGALTELAAAAEAAGHDEPARAHAERILALDPADEAAHRLLLRLYLRFGQLDRARRQYDWCVRALAEALDAAPAEETRALVRGLRAV